MKKILIQIWLSNPVQGGVVAIITSAWILGLMILIAWVHSLF
jgi:hypothetical protein